MVAQSLFCSAHFEPLQTEDGGRRPGWSAEVHQALCQLQDGASADVQCSRGAESGRAEVHQAHNATAAPPPAPTLPLPNFQGVADRGQPKSPSAISANPS